MNPESVRRVQNLPNPMEIAKAAVIPDRLTPQMKEPKKLWASHIGHLVMAGQLKPDEVNIADIKQNIDQGTLPETWEQTAEEKRNLIGFPKLTEIDNLPSSEDEKIGLRKTSIRKAELANEETLGRMLLHGAQFGDTEINTIKVMTERGTILHENSGGSSSQVEEKFGEGGKTPLTRDANGESIYDDVIELLKSGDESPDGLAQARAELVNVTKGDKKLRKEADYQNLQKYIEEKTAMLKAEKTVAPAGTTEINLDQQEQEDIALTLEKAKQRGLNDEETATEVSRVSEAYRRAKLLGSRGEMGTPSPPLTREQEDKILEEANHGKIGWTDWTQELIDIWRAGDREIAFARADREWEEKNNIGEGQVLKNPDGTYSLDNSQRPSIKAGLSSINTKGELVVGEAHDSPLYIRTNEIRKLVLEHHAKNTTSHSPGMHVENVHDIQTTLSRAQGTISAFGIYDRRYGLDYSAITEAAQGWLYDPLEPMKKMWDAGDWGNAIAIATANQEVLFTRVLEVFQKAVPNIKAMSEEYKNNPEEYKRIHGEDSVTVSAAARTLNLIESEDFREKLVATPIGERDQYIRQINWMVYGLTKEDALKAANGQMDQIDWRGAYGFSEEDTLEMESRPQSNSPLHPLGAMAETMWYATFREGEFNGSNKKSRLEWFWKVLRLDQSIVDQRGHHVVWESEKGQEVLRNLRLVTFWERIPGALDQEWEEINETMDRDWEQSTSIAAGSVIKNPDGTYSLDNSQRPSIREGRRHINQDGRLVINDSARPSVKVGLREVDPATGELKKELDPVTGKLRTQKVVERFDNVKFELIDWKSVFKPQWLIVITDGNKASDILKMTGDNGPFHTMKLRDLLNLTAREKVFRDLKDQDRADALIPLIDFFIDYNLKSFQPGSGMPELEGHLRLYFYSIRDKISLNMSIEDTVKLFIELRDKYWDKMTPKDIYHLIKPDHYEKRETKYTDRKGVEQTAMV